MKTRTLFLLLVLVVLLWLFKPAQVWGEARRMWRQRELMLKVLVAMIVLYLLYGMYELYERGWLTSD
ncbi:MAG: hypothetical protein DCC55_00605 [Chloroflexi bacterium]|nr:MAG: hypothetical protein DCC55_00605 [Chloroflexota bacterium]